MTRERLYLFDTTLRDGAQTPGVDFTVSDKRRVAKVLDELGIDYIEGGYPGANQTDTEFFGDAPQLAHAKLTAFGMTKRAGRSASNDPGLAAVIQSAAPAICLVAKSWDFHVRVALGITNAEAVDSVADSFSSSDALPSASVEMAATTATPFSASPSFPGSWSSLSTRNALGSLFKSSSDSSSFATSSESFFVDFSLLSDLVHAGSSGCNPSNPLVTRSDESA